MSGQPSPKPLGWSAGPFQIQFPLHRSSFRSSRLHPQHQRRAARWAPRALGALPRLPRNRRSPDDQACVRGDRLRQAAARRAEGGGGSVDLEVLPPAVRAVAAVYRLACPRGWRQLLRRPGGGRRPFTPSRTRLLQRALRLEGCRVVDDVIRDVDVQIGDLHRPAVDDLGAPAPGVCIGRAAGRVACGDRSRAGAWLQPAGSREGQATAHAGQRMPSG